MTEPLLFVCVRELPLFDAAPSPPHFFSIENPVGPAFMAFGSHELAEAVLLLFGAGPGVFLVSESQLSAELIGSLAHHRVVVLRTAEDYDEATANAPGFPWTERMIDYNFAAALARGAV